MKLSHLLVDAIQAERRIEIENRQRSSRPISSQAVSRDQATRPESVLRRLLPAH